MFIFVYWQVECDEFMEIVESIIGPDLICRPPSLVNSLPTVKRPDGTYPPMQKVSLEEAKRRAAARAREQAVTDLGTPAFPDLGTPAITNPGTPAVTDPRTPAVTNLGTAAPASPAAPASTVAPAGTAAPASTSTAEQVPASLPFASALDPRLRGTYGIQAPPEGVPALPLATLVTSIEVDFVKDDDADDAEVPSPTTIPRWTTYDDFDQVDYNVDESSEQEPVEAPNYSPTPGAAVVRAPPGLMALGLPAGLAYRNAGLLQVVSQAVAGVAGRDVHEAEGDLARSVTSATSTPRGAWCPKPDHWQQTGLGCPEQFSCFTKGLDGELCMIDRFETARWVSNVVASSYI